MRTLIYARYSSQLQNPRSIAAQAAACRARAEQEGWEIVGEYSDAAISGAAGIDDAQRPGLAAMLARIEALRGTPAAVQQVLTESTDRIARHQGDAFAVRELLEHAGARLFTLMDGEVDEITGTIKGLLDARMRKDLAARVRRGHKGNIAEGRAASGVAYGYRKVARLDEKGELVRGLREVDEETAAIVRRIFTEYDAGSSPRAIANGLNADGIPAPRGAIWRPSTIIGHRKCAFGVLANPIYIGRLQYGRSKSVRDPRTRARSTAPGDGPVVEGEAPHLRIIEQDLWDRVQAQIEERATGPAQRQRRPKHLLSGLGECGTCGGNWIVVATGYFGCSTFAGGGKGACTNNRMIKAEDYERRVLAELKAELLDPDVVAAYLDEYGKEHARVRREAAQNHALLDRRAAKAEAKVARLVAAIADGGGEFAEIREALAAAKAEAETIARERRALDAIPTIALHPGLSRQYRAAVENLERELADETTKAQAAPKLRALIAKIVLSPKPPPAKRGVVLEVIRHIEETLTALQRQA
ncbi:recombinase family protein [Qipengyuania sp. 6B39]|uniref:recombinase family protein n=1 Tax=Qipengyuania proteolytica TaxID=2867239 RepID=UPI001C8AFD77|nr:recombinase family protein [Qipengyuania proteolytica]MBX7496797.1 recombinase family protein [Qipengyuania proteolytica]